MLLHQREFFIISNYFSSVVLVLQSLFLLALGSGGLVAAVNANLQCPQPQGMAEILEHL